MDLDANQLDDLKLRAEQSLMLLGGAPVKVKPEELRALVLAILDASDVEELQTSIAFLKEDVHELREEVKHLEKENKRLEGLVAKLEGRAA